MVPRPSCAITAVSLEQWEVLQERFNYSLTLGTTTNLFNDVLYETSGSALKSALVESLQTA